MSDTTHKSPSRFWELNIKKLVSFFNKHGTCLGLRDEQSVDREIDQPLTKEMEFHFLFERFVFNV